MEHNKIAPCHNCERGGHPDFCDVIESEPVGLFELELRLAEATAYMEDISARMTGTDHDWISTHWVFEVAERCIKILKGET